MVAQKLDSTLVSADLVLIETLKGKACSNLWYNNMLHGQNQITT
jgi:hypothetical protein